MPNTTPRMDHSFPSSEEDPWYDSFVDYTSLVDSSQYAYREDRNVVFAGGGALSWNATTGVLTWDENISILAAVTGYLWLVGAGNVTIDAANGVIFYATLDRAPGANTTVSSATANRLGSIAPDNVLVIAVRIGTTLYFRTGLVLEDGGSATGVAPGGGGGGAGSYITAALAYSYTEAALPVVEVMGQIVFDGSLASTVNLLAILTPTLTAGSCSILLYDLGVVGTPAAPRLVSTLTTAVSGGPQVLQQTLTSVAAAPGVNEIPQANHVYEVVVTSAALVGDTVYVGSARLEVA